MPAVLVLMVAGVVGAVGVSLFRSWWKDYRPKR